MGEIRNEQTGADDQYTAKKVYRKPGVQMYGTLSQVTQLAPNTSPHRTDPNFPGPPSSPSPAPNSRT